MELRAEVFQGHWRGTFQGPRGGIWGIIEGKDRAATIPTTPQQASRIQKGQHVHFARETGLHTERERDEPELTREEIEVYQAQLNEQGTQLKVSPEEFSGRWQGARKDYRGQRWGVIEREDQVAWVRLNNDETKSRELDVGAYVQAKGAPFATLRDRSEPRLTREEIEAYQARLKEQGTQFKISPEEFSGRWQGARVDYRGQRWGVIAREDQVAWVRLENDHQGRTLEPGTPVHVQGKDELEMTPDRQNPL